MKTTTNMNFTALTEWEAYEIYGCHDCPLGRHLDGHRYDCSDNKYTTNSRSTPNWECRDAITQNPEKYRPVFPIPDLQGIEPYEVCEYLGLNLDYPDDERQQAFISVDLKGEPIGRISEKDGWYQSTRLQGFKAQNEYLLALHLVHPDYLWNVANRIIEYERNRPEVPDYT